MVSAVSAGSQVLHSDTSRSYSHAVDNPGSVTLLGANLEAKGDNPIFIKSLDLHYKMDLTGSVANSSCLQQD